MTKPERAHQVFEQIVSCRIEVAYYFLELGKLFKEVRDDRLYEVLGHETFGSFIADPQISFSRATVYWFIEAHEKYILKLGVDYKALLEIGHGKLRIIAPIIDENNKDEWLGKARELSRSDLRAEVGELQGKSLPSSKEISASAPCLTDRQNYLEFVKYQPCATCNKKPTVGHHFPRTKGAGADDWKVIPLCVECHSESHTLPSKWLWENRIMIFDYFYGIIGKIFNEEEKRNE